MIMIVIMMILMMKVGFKVVILTVSLTNVIILANMKYEDHDSGDDDKYDDNFEYFMSTWKKSRNLR